MLVAHIRLPLLLHCCARDSFVLVSLTSFWCYESHPDFIGISSLMPMFLQLGWLVNVSVVVLALLRLSSWMTPSLVRSWQVSSSWEATSAAQRNIGWRDCAPNICASTKSSTATLKGRCQLGGSAQGIPWRPTYWGEATHARVTALWRRQGQKAESAETQTDVEQADTTRAAQIHTVAGRL